MWSTGLCYNYLGSLSTLQKHHYPMMDHSYLIIQAPHSKINRYKQIQKQISLLAKRRTIIYIYGKIDPQRNFLNQRWFMKIFFTLVRLSSSVNRFFEMTEEIWSGRLTGYTLVGARVCRTQELDSMFG